MRLKRISAGIGILMLSMAIFSSLAGMAAAAEYTFKIENNANVALKKLMVSEDGEDWGYFDIGSGVPAGESRTLVWGEAAEGQKCRQYVKAIFSDGTTSKPKKYDFCEKGLALEFH